MKKILKKKSSLIFLILTIFILSMATQSIGRALFLLIILAIWYITSLKYGMIFAGIIFFLLTLPFNVTIQLPQEILGFEIYNPFVIGVIINQLIPTISVCDLAILLILTGVIVEERVRIRNFFVDDWKNILPLLIGSSYFLIHNLIFRDFLVFFQSARFLFWWITFYLLNILIRKEFSRSRKSCCLSKGNDSENLEKKFKQNNKDSTSSTNKNKAVTTKILGYLKFNGLSTQTLKQWLLLTLFIVIIVQFTVGSIQFKQGFSIGLKFLGESRLIKGYAKTSWTELGGRLYLRAYGTFPHPNLLAGYLTLTQIILISTKFKKKLLIIIKYIILTLSSTLILLTLSRIGFFLLFINILLLIIRTLEKHLNYFSKLYTLSKGLIKNRTVLSKKPFKSKISFKKCQSDPTTIILKNTPLILLSGIGLVLPIIIIFHENIIIERILALFSSGSVSVTDRVNLIKVAWQILKNNWLTGVGTNRFIAAMGKDAPITAGQRLLFEPVHNIFILILVEHGIIAGIIFIYFLFKYLIKNLPDIHSIIFWLNSIIWLLIISTFDHYLITLPQGLALLFIFLIYQKMLKFK